MTDRTPAAQWRENGEPDPHGTHYDGERAQLAMGHMTDDEFANELFLNGDVQPSVQQLIEGSALRPIVWLTAAKERIRWLSRALERELARNAHAPSTAPVEALQEILRVHANDNARPRAFYIASDALAKFHSAVEQDAGPSQTPCPPELTDEMIRAALAVQWPALYRDSLFAEHDGPEVRKATEQRIAAVRKQWEAMHAAAGAAARPAAAEPAAQADLTPVFDALQIGSAARTPAILLANVQNLIRREHCLSALERTFFTVQTPPEPCEGEDEPGEDCLLNWGHEPENYLKAFREALGTLFGALPSFGWTNTSERRPDAGELIVKRWKSGSVWAGVYSGTEKDSSFDEWCALPKDFIAQTFNDLPTDFKSAKATILSLPEEDVRGLAISQFILLQLHEKYPDGMPGIVPRDVRATFDAMADAFLPTFGANGSDQRERMWKSMVDAAFGVPAEGLRERLAPLLNEFGMRQWQSGRGVSHESVEDAFDAVLDAATQGTQRG